MSTNTPLSTDRRTVADGVLIPFVSYVRTAVTRLLRAVAFWLAVFLPLCYVPLLVFAFDTPAVRELAASLIGLNALALVFGHAHRRD